MASRKRSRAISPDLESGFSPRRLFSNLERVPQRLKPDFRPVLTARLRFAEAVPLQNLRKPRNTPANLDKPAACCVSSMQRRMMALLGSSISEIAGTIQRCCRPTQETQHAASLPESCNVAMVSNRLDLSIPALYMRFAAKLFVLLVSFAS